MPSARTILAALVLAFAPQTARAAESFVCFVYHRFGDARFPSTNVDAGVFEAQLAWLRDGGYTVLTLGRALSVLDSAGTVPERTVVLTVDDGYTSFRVTGAPLLRRFGWSATLFVNTESVGNPGYMSWSDLRDLAAAGVEIGNHTASHATFLDVPEAERAGRLGEDVARAQAVFRDSLGFAPALFAYPYGEYDLRMKTRIKAMGFIAAAAQNSGPVSRHSDRYALPRFPMGGPYATLEGLARKAAMRALPVASVRPESPLWTKAEPPVVEVTLAPGGPALGRAQCFVNGRPDCDLSPLPDGAPGLRIAVTKPLSARRTIVTLTVPAAGAAWHWYSRPFFFPGRPE